MTPPPAPIGRGRGRGRTPRPRPLDRGPFGAYPALRRWEPILAKARSLAREPFYVVGGALRDALLGRESDDLDLACGGSAEEFARRLAAATKGRLVVLDEATRVYRIVLQGASRPRQIDVAQIQGRSIEEDLRRRDFACNAMALPAAAPGPILDPRGGALDLRRRLLRADIPEVLAEDPLRLLRAFRVAAQAGFTIEPSTLRAIRARRALALAPAGERLRQELLALLSVSPCHSWLRLMDEAGLLTALLPKLEAARRCAEVYYGDGGVLRHTLEAVARLDLLLAELDEIFPDIAPDLRRHYEAEGGLAGRAPLLRLAVLLHDVAKPPTARRIGGRLRFFRHDELGARMAADILGRLRFSGAEIELVTRCIRHHLRPGNLAANRIVSDKAVHRLFRDLGPAGVSLALVCWADHASYLPGARLRPLLRHARRDPHTFPASAVRGEAARKTLRHLQVLHFLLHAYFRRRERVVPSRLLDGHDVMQTLALPPGPAIGKILADLSEAQAEGKVRSRAEALRFVKKSRF